MTIVLMTMLRVIKIRQSKQTEMLIAAGERKRIIHRVSNSVPATFQVQIEAVNPQEVLAGFIEIEKSAVLIDKNVERLPLEAEMTLEAGFLDAFYSVYVVPDHDIRLFHSGAPAKTTRMIFFYALAITVIALIIYLLFTL